MGNQIEVTTLTLCCDRSLQVEEARQLRGFFGQKYRNRPEFHHHGPAGLVYHHPLIQYKVIGGVGRVMGVGTGSFLLRAVDPPDVLFLSGQAVKVIEFNRTTEATEFGPVTGSLDYRFLTPWLALNSSNLVTYRGIRDRQAQGRLLARILIGNLLSLCKAVGVTVTERLFARVDVERTEQIEIKKGVALIGLRGKFEMNFRLPKMWGIGKQSARGFGSVIEMEGNNG